MNTEVRVVPNLPPALAERIGVMVGEATMQWENIDQAGVFKSTEAARIVEEIKVAVAESWDAREAVLFAHLRNMSYNLGQMVSSPAPGTWEHHFENVQRGVDNVLRLLEQHR